MLTPLLLQIAFWLGVLGCVGAGVLVMLDDGGITKNLVAGQGGNLLAENKFAVGAVIIIVGPIILRLAFELILLPFTINGTLTSIRRSLIKMEQERSGNTTAHSPAQSDIPPPRMRR
jgi:hypothetical protein